MKEHEQATENKSGAGHHGHHANMAADIRKRFWILPVSTPPIFLLSPALGAMLMAASTVNVAINARLLRLKK